MRADGQLGNIQSISNLYGAARAGKLPAVAWVNPNNTVSEHPPSSVRTGQAYVTSLINEIMRGPQWRSTAIFVSWDDWGGFYDHVRPPVVDQNGYGLRVPGLVISPYAKRGYIDHQTLSMDAYVKFVEDDFLGGRRLDPATDGRPDPRPDVREVAPQLGDLRTDFDFDQQPRRPLILNPEPLPWPGPGPVTVRLRPVDVRSQLIRRPALTAQVRCTRLCATTVGAVVTDGRQEGLLAMPQPRLVGANQPTTLSLPMTQAVRQLARRALRNGRRVTVTIEALSEAQAGWISRARRRVRIAATTSRAPSPAPRASR